MLAGALLQAGAQVGMHVLSKTLSDRYLRAAHERMFAPLGLRVRLCKTPALRKLVDHPEAGKEEPSKLKKFGQSAGDVVLRLPFPLMKKAARFFMDKHPPIDARITDPLTRRLMFMQGYILPVEHGPAIPPPSKPDKVLDKMNGFAVGRKRGKTNRKARDVAVRREILAGMPVSRRNYIMTMMKTRGSSQRLQTKVEDDARREHRANEKLVWLVIINEADGGLPVSSRLSKGSLLSPTRVQMRRSLGRKPWMILATTSLSVTSNLKKRGKYTWKSRTATTTSWKTTILTHRRAEAIRRMVLYSKRNESFVAVSSSDVHIKV